MELRIKPTSEYKKTSIDETLKLLETTESGLTGTDVKNRLGIFGHNAIEEKRGNPLLEFVRRYWGPMPWLLELAMALSFTLKHNIEGIIIFVLLTVNAIIGFMHSRGSQKAVELLKQRLAIKAKVLRDGDWSMVDAGGIVPGDIIVVKLGDIVPADAKIISGDISIDESALTGESLPVESRDLDTIYSGSVVRRGEARCVVVNTGANTYFGKTAELVKIAKPKSHQEEIMLAIVKYMMYLGIAASIIVAIYAFTIHESILLILTFAVIFLMGAVPVALPAVLTIVQAATGMKLAEEGILVTRLDSIEDAASISILCLDKTGTITQNKLSVADSIPFSGYTKEDVVTIANLASRAEGMDLIDTAIIDYAKSIGANHSSQKQISYTPFNPSIKRTEAVIENNGNQYKAIKGAAQIVIPMCVGIDKSVLDLANKTIENLSEKGYRTIAVAKSEDGDFDNMKLVGFLPLADPPRPDSKTMIEEARKLGVKSIMLTGDNISISKEIAQQVGIGDKIIRLKDIEGLSEDEQAKIASESDGFAEIYPEDKYKIVRLLQSRGLMVGMTGDGVNDAPALKQAEMGIAVSNATDVAKASASVVLTEPGVSVIVEAIKRSRETYQRMLTWVINKVTKVIQVVGLLTIGFFMMREMVLSLLGMSLLVFANDFVTMSLATDNVKHTDNPNKWDVKNITLASLIIGALLVVEGVIAIIGGVSYFHLSFPKLQTFIMLMLVFTSQFRVLIVRERNFFWSSFPGKALLASSSGSIIAFILLGVYGIFMPALTLQQVMAALGFSAVFTLAIDIPKYYSFKLFGL
ncbi:MAG: plasma-membrane proton-efflux P-type ATPase [Bacteroidetes bacterium]|nr:plasma-membrane proton-efflux P-type ATPase [Bacteroidota bacterium]MCL5737768.1 plasma-membrane proton-efflux P-type ATPase [Bacteroidota bacterium]